MKFKDFCEEEYEYNLFCEYVTKYENGTIEEFQLPSFIQDKIDFIKNLASIVKVDIQKLFAIFKNKIVFKFFSKIKWSFDYLFKLVKMGFQVYKDLRGAVAEYIANTPVGKWTEEKLRALDGWLKKHPVVKRIGGIAVAALLAYIWFKMGFTGDFEYDFSMGDMLAALAGKFSLADLFAGPSGIQMLMMLVIGTLGLSFPWPGPQTIQFAASVVISLAKAVKVKLPIIKKTK